MITGVGVRDVEMRLSILNCLIVVATLVLLCEPVGADQKTAKETVDLPYQSTEIRFDDLAPPGLTHKHCWNALGMDDQGRVYVGISSVHTGGREDVAVYRYDPKQSKRQFLGTFLEAARAANNLHPGENIPKGHTRILFADGKMFMASQGFHDFKQELDDLQKYRGSHIFSYDIASGTWQDLAASLPNGVITKHQGIVALNIIRSEHLLVGLSHPHSDIVLFDYRQKRTKNIISGIPWKLGNPLSREVIIARNGDVYTYRGTELPAHRHQTNPVWVFDRKSGSLEVTQFQMSNGFWIGQAETRDGQRVFVSTINGQLSEFDTETGTFHDLGYMLPMGEVGSGRRIRYQYGITLSPDEQRIFFVPGGLANPRGRGELYSYDIGTRQVTHHGRLPAGIYTSGDIRDDRFVYLCGFGTTDDVWSGNVRLLVLRVVEN